MITVSYSGVHQAYQLALAAQEASLLERFYCSFYDAPGMWGGRLSKMFGADVLSSRRLEGLELTKVVEYPWPELLHKLRGRLLHSKGSAWISAAYRFDRWAAKQLEYSASRGIVCTENCAYEAFRAAAKRNMIKIYDCPGTNADILRHTTEEAARQTGLPFVSTADTPEIARRKELEISLADVVLTYSDFHTQGLMARGVSRERIAQIPLWTDADFWCPCPGSRRRSGALKVLFVGGINLRKGVPFVVEAVRRLAPHATLTLVGILDPDARACLVGTDSFANVIPPVDKQTLRAIYRSHDVLVLPSLGDSFGFVAMEAMACGLPAIITTHCGAPVPDEDWRVPVMDSNAIQEQLEVYLQDSEQHEIDSKAANRFAGSFTPLRYRSAIGEMLRNLKPCLI